MNKSSTGDAPDLNFKDLIQKMPTGFAYHQLVTDTEGRGVDYVFLEVNQAFEKITGLKKEGVLGKRFTDVLMGVENDKGRLIERYSKVAQTGKEDKFEYYSNSVNKWFEVYAYSPKENFFAVIIDDISQEKKEKDNGVLYKMLLDKTSDIITILDISLNPKYTFANKAHEKILGYANKDIIGKCIFEFIHPDDAPQILTSLLENFTQEGGKLLQKNVIPPSKNITCRIKNSAGVYTIIESTVDVIENNFFVVSRDMTAKAMLLKNLTEEQIKTENYFDIVGNAIVVLSKNAVVIKINKSGCALLEDTMEHIVGKNWIETYIPKEEQEKVQAVFKKISESTPVEYFENYIIAKSGTKKLIRWHNKLLTNNQGGYIGTLSSGEDITAQRTAQNEVANNLEELEKFNKLAIHRELKMVELKNEIKRLQEEIKHPTTNLS